jgi:RNA polymerase sigma-70 factor (ECF subfamily)
MAHDAPYAGEDRKTVSLERGRPVISIHPPHSSARTYRGRMRRIACAPYVFKSEGGTGAEGVHRNDGSRQEHSRVPSSREEGILDHDTTLGREGILDQGDASLQARLLRDDQKAFRELVERYTPLLVNLASGIVYDRETARDIVQDTFTSFYASLHRFNGKASIRTYLYRIAVNKSIDYVRKMRTRARLQSKLNADYEATADPTDRVDDRIVVREALASLPVKLRMPLVMVECQRLRYGEIAKILGIPLNTVRTRIYRAREQLRREFRERGVAG